MKKSILFFLIMLLSSVVSYSQIYKSIEPFIQNDLDGYYYGFLDGFHIKVKFNENEAKAYQLFEVGDYENCIKLTSLAIIDHLNTPEESKSILSYLYYITGVSYSKLMLYEEAIAFFTKSIKNNTALDGSFDVKFRSLYLEDGSITVSPFHLYFLEEYTGKTLNIGDVYMRRGFLKGDLGDKMGAVTDFRKGIALVPKNSLYYTKLAASLIVVDFEYHQSEAVRLLEEAIAMDDNNGEAYLWRGLLNIMRSYSISGCEDLTKAGELGEKRAYEAIKQFCN